MGELIQNLKAKYSILQLGDEREPIFEGAHRYAGQLSMRENPQLFFPMPPILLDQIACLCISQMD